MVGLEGNMVGLISFDIAVTGAVKLCLGKSVDDADAGRK